MSTSTASANTSTPSGAADFRVIEVRASYHNLIPSRFPPIALYERIAAGRHDAIAAVEDLTNPRLRERARILGATSGKEPPPLQNWNHAPFAYPNPDGTRFFGPTRPALELADDVQTALAVSVAKREAFLTRTDEAPLDLDMRVLTRTVAGRVADGRAWDPGLSRDERWRRGEAVLAAGADGILFRCPERPSSTCIAIVNGGTLERAVQCDHFRFIWDGRRIRALYSFTDGKEVSPEELGSPQAVLAA